MPRLSIAVPTCVAEDFEGEIVALNLDTGLYFSFPGLAGAIWRDLNAGHPPETIVTELAAANDVLGQDASRFINDLVSYGLLRENGEAESALPEMECRTLIERGEFKLSFSTHDDMKDLVMTDPIHDVDETAGWPVFRDRA